MRKCLGRVLSRGLLLRRESFQTSLEEGVSKPDERHAARRSLKQNRLSNSNLPFKDPVNRQVRVLPRLVQPDKQVLVRRNDQRLHGLKWSEERHRQDVQRPLHNGTSRREGMSSRPGRSGYNETVGPDREKLLPGQTHLQPQHLSRNRRSHQGLVQTLPNHLPVDGNRDLPELLQLEIPLHPP